MASRANLYARLFGGASVAALLLGAVPAWAQEAGNATAVDELIVTAQKREERIQDVPIAITAMSPEQMDAQKIEGGFDLLRAIPNVAFSKSNYSGYNFSIRGVGTKAVSATSDPAVAVAFNNNSLIRNRLFEQEYLDLERVEVLRGPQGTLYGRNATSGVINVITAKPAMGEFFGESKLEVGNYDSRRMTGMLNLPLGDALAVRLAGAFTKRDGYGTNTWDGSDIDGRDLWSTRLSIGWEPNDRLRVDAIWERFEEDDNRLRTGKQLCHRDPGPETVAGYAGPLGPIQRGRLSQGCIPGSLYSKDAFQAPNGIAIPFVAVGQLGFSYGSLTPNPPVFGPRVMLLKPGIDPYDVQQSRDLRTISSQFDAEYRAKADILALTVAWDVTDHLTLTSQTAYNDDRVWSFQDYNRFATQPTFNDSTGTYNTIFGFPMDQPSFLEDLAPGGYYTDPQIGRSNTLA
ncbi:MAG: TonB-denpendent receptor, partial [Caulobacter sp.]|nr:TonB-denpendent receptor [Caulobacter sp.]